MVEQTCWVWLTVCEMLPIHIKILLLAILISCRDQSNRSLMKYYRISIFNLIYDCYLLHIGSWPNPKGELFLGNLILLSNCKRIVKLIMLESLLSLPLMA